MAHGRERSRGTQWVNRPRGLGKCVKKWGSEETAESGADSEKKLLVVESKRSIRQYLDVVLALAQSFLLLLSCIEA
jgi:hypothetical protein